MRIIFTFFIFLTLSCSAQAKRNQLILTPQKYQSLNQISQRKYIANLRSVVLKFEVETHKHGKLLSSRDQFAPTDFVFSLLLPSANALEQSSDNYCIIGGMGRYVTRLKQDKALCPTKYRSCKNESDENKNDSSIQDEGFKCGAIYGGVCVTRSHSESGFEKLSERCHLKGMDIDISAEDYVKVALTVRELKQAKCSEVKPIENPKSDGSDLLGKTPCEYFVTRLQQLESRFSEEIKQAKIPEAFIANDAKADGATEASMTDTNAATTPTTTTTTDTASAPTESDSQEKKQIALSGQYQECASPAKSSDTVQAHQFHYEGLAAMVLDPNCSISHIEVRSGKVAETEFSETPRNSHCSVSMDAGKIRKTPDGDVVDYTLKVFPTDKSKKVESFYYHLPLNIHHSYNNWKQWMTQSDRGPKYCQPKPNLTPPTTNAVASSNGSAAP